MASHHHYHHHHQNPSPTSNCADACGGSCCCNHRCCLQPHQPPTPQFLAIDPPLQYLISLLQQQQKQQLPTLYPHTHQNHPQELRFKPPKAHFQQQEVHHHDSQSVLSTLLRRISALESSLQSFSTTSHSSLRDAAALLIQTHFRAFLVRRSRTLSQLKDLAVVKSSFDSLKSSVSGQTHFDFDAVSDKATALLLKLDSIKGGDPMIREGKRSISRDLVRFLEFLDGFVFKKHAVSYKPVKNAKIFKNSDKSRVSYGKTCHGVMSGNQEDIVGKLRERVERIRGFSRASDNVEEDAELEGFQQCIDEDDDYNDDRKERVYTNGEPVVFKVTDGVSVKGHDDQPRVKKTVSFNENGNAYVVYGDTDESVLNGDGSLTDESDSSDNHGEAMENHCSEADKRKISSYGNKNGGDFHLESDGSLASRYHTRNPTRVRKSGGDAQIGGYCQDRDGNLVFSAPMPVKMESVADMMNIKPTKIVR